MLYAVVCEWSVQRLPLAEPAIGVVLGVKDFAVLSSGARVEHPKWLGQSDRRLAKSQCWLSRKKKGSENRQGARVLVAMLQQRMKNQRQDFLRKISHQRISENQVVSMEGLRVSTVVRSRHRDKAISEPDCSELARQLQYKAQRHGRTLQVIDTFGPASKRCSDRGHVNRDLKLSQRVWQCPACLVGHGREHNAAVNIEGAGRDMPEETPAAGKGLCRTSAVEATSPLIDAGSSHGSVSLRCTAVYPVEYVTFSGHSCRGVPRGTIRLILR